MKKDFPLKKVYTLLESGPEKGSGLYF